MNAKRLIVVLILLVCVLCCGCLTTGGMENKPESLLSVREIHRIVDFADTFCSQLILFVETSNLEESTKRGLIEGIEQLQTAIRIVKESLELIDKGKPVSICETVEQVSRILRLIEDLQPKIKSLRDGM